MADYAFSIVGLISPTQPAYIQAYRPALAVLNTGTKPLTLGGTFSVYERQAPGRLLFQTGWIAATVASGDSVQLLGATYWTPPATGDYTVAAHVTSNRPNLFHDFGPLALHVSGGEPPEPPVVTAHATQHEIGGGDQVNVTNLRGELYDPQPPKDHASRHEQGGADEMSVNQLHGTLADPQPSANHGNESHTPAFVDVMVLEEALDNHNAAPTAHADATNLEHVANKGAASGYAGLDVSGMVASAVLGSGGAGGANEFLAADRTWRTAPVSNFRIARTTNIVPVPEQVPIQLCLGPIATELLDGGAILRGTIRAAVYQEAGIPAHLVAKLQYAPHGTSGWSTACESQSPNTVPDSGFTICEWVFLSQFTPRTSTDNRLTTTATATQFPPSGTTAFPLTISGFGGPNSADFQTLYDWRLTLETDGTAGLSADVLTAFIELVQVP
jgi:hypothetical protein